MGWTRALTHRLTDCSRVNIPFLALNHGMLGAHNRSTPSPPEIIARIMIRNRKQIKRRKIHISEPRKCESCRFALAHALHTMRELEIVMKENALAPYYVHENV
jgi:hypothetical protein